jgi:AcrR family transcriptional regulator
VTDTLDDVGRTLLDAAGDVLATDGPSALTVRRIAAEAGVSTMNVYSRFGGKDGIVEHLWLEGFTRLADSTRSVAVTDDPIADLRACGESYRRFATRNRPYYAVMFDRVVPTFVPSEPARVHALGALELLADRCAKAMDLWRIPRADPLTTAAAVWAGLHGVVSLELKGVGPHSIDWDEVFRVTSDAVLAGLVAGAGAAARGRRGRTPR